MPLDKDFYGGNATGMECTLAQRSIGSHVELSAVVPELDQIVVRREMRSVFS